MENEIEVDRIFDDGDPAIAFFSPNSDFKSSQEYKIFAQLAEKFHPNIAFLTGISGKGTAKEFGEYFGIDELNYQLVAMKAETEEEIEKFIYKGEWNFSDVENWIQSFIDGKLVREYKSEEIPEKNDGAVKVFVGKNFAENVFGDDKHVLVEFYAPWCGHCQEVKKIFLKNLKNFFFTILEIFSKNFY